MTAAYSRTAGETVGASPYTISAVLSPAAVLGNYDITYNTALFAITAKDASVVVASKTKEYGSADPALTGTLTGFMPADNVIATYSRVAGEAVADYAITAVLSPAAVLSNYNITNTPALLSITKKAASVSPIANSKVYGSNDPALAGTLAGFLAGDNVTAAYSRTAGETVGASPYTISAVLSPAAVLGNYDITYNTALFAITAKDASVVVASKTKEYGSADPALTGTLTGFMPADNVIATYSRVAGEAVADYAITAVLSPAAVLSNYNITNTPALLSITKKAASVSPIANSKVYGSNDPALAGTLAGFLAGDNVTAAYSRTAGETVGASPYTISAVLSPAAVLGNYDITYNTALFAITAKDASVVVASKTKEYGSADPALTGTLTGFMPADNVIATYSRVAGEAVADYAITAVLSPAAVLSNYNITNTPALLSITKKAASVSPIANSKVYGSNDPALAGTLAGFLAGDNVTAAYSRTAGETVGASPYTISAVLSPAAVLGNYDITYNTALFAITAKDASVVVASKTKEYGSADPALTGTLTGFMPADNVIATYSRVAGEAVADYAITAVLSPAAVLSNYNITNTPALLSITKKAASVSPIANSKVYGSNDPALAGTLAGFLAGDNVTAAYSRTAGETVGASPYTISAVLSPAAVLGNYDITYNTALFAITARPITVTANAQTKECAASEDPVLTYTFSPTPLPNNDSFTGSLTRDPGDMIGTYAIKQGSLALSTNYELTYVGANLVISDDTPPIVSAKNIIILLDAFGKASITVAQVDNGSSDACGIVSSVLSKTDFDCSNVGNNNVTLTVTDKGNHAASSTAVVTVVDDISPTIAAPAATTGTTNVACTSTNVVLGTPTAADNCHVASVTNNAPSAFPIGPTTVIWTVTDDAGNTATATQLVIVTDDQEPNVVCKNITISLSPEGQASITASDIDNGSFDNCGISSIVASKTTFTCADLGTNTVMLIVTDNSGNSSTCNAVVTVIDPNAPLLSVSDASASENEGTAKVKVSLTNSRTCDVTFTVSTADNSALGSTDYTPVNSIVYTIPAGSTSVVISVPITNDQISEPTETFYINISNPTLSKISDSQGVVSILDDDSPPSISIGDASAKEGADLSFSVTLNHMSSSNIDVTIGFTNVTASDNDYTNTPIIVSIPAGTTTAKFAVPSTADHLQELDETFVAKVISVTGSAGDTNDTGTGTIVDDDDYPIAADDVVSTNEDTPVKGNVSLNDMSNNLLTDVWSVVQAPAHGAVTMNPDGTYTYTPESNYNGNDGFIYKVCDGEGDCDEASVSLTVLPVDDFPIANDDQVSFHIDDVLNDWVTDNDVESGDGGSVWSILTQPTHGTIIFNTDGSYTYTPGLNFIGSDTFTYQLCDIDGDCDQATVTISIDDIVSPNQVLTPNGDNHNDTFIINGIEFYPENDLTIYNRWGNKVYQKSGYMNEWDGVSNENKVGSMSLPVGTYFYVLKYGNQRHKTGYVYLDR